MTTLQRRVLTIAPLAIGALALILFLSFTAPAQPNTSPTWGFPDQCPVCGTMAPPWIPGAAATDPVPPCQPETVYGENGAKTILHCAPDARFIACRRCNAVFRQYRSFPGAKP
jgi:hypothetical protein